MGQGWSSRNSLFVMLDKPIYAPGDAIHATIALNCHKPFVCDKLKIKLVGVENVKVKGTVSERNFRTNVIEVEHVVHDFAGRVEQGQYSFPVTFHLPTWLQSSISVNDRAQTRASITYTIWATCSVNSRMSVKKEKVTAHQEVVVLTHVPPTPEPELKEVTFPVSGLFGAWNRGQATARLQLTSANFAAEATAQRVAQSLSAFYTVNNTTRARFRVRIQLLRHFRVRNANGRVVYNTKHVMRDIKLHRVEPLGEVASEAHVPLNCALGVTCAGSFVNLEFALKLKIKGSSILGKGTEIIVPVKLFGQTMGFVPAPMYQPPPDWRPQEFAPVQVPLPAQPPAVISDFTPPSYSEQQTGWGAGMGMGVPQDAALPPGYGDERPPAHNPGYPAQPPPQYQPQTQSSPYQNPRPQAAAASWTPSSSASQSSMPAAHAAQDDVTMFQPGFGTEHGDEQGLSAEAMQSILEAYPETHPTKQ